MLTTFTEEEILSKIHEFYNTYEELLKKFLFNYVVLDGNTTIEAMKTIMKREIDNLMYGIAKVNA